MILKQLTSVQHYSGKGLCCQMNERSVFLGQKAELTMLRLPGATLMVRLSGEWKLGRELPQREEGER